MGRKLALAGLSSADDNPPSLLPANFTERFILCHFVTEITTWSRNPVHPLTFYVREVIGYFFRDDFAKGMVSATSAPPSALSPISTVHPCA